MNTSATFRASDGRDYAFNTYYPWPFIKVVNGISLAVLPSWELARRGLLFYLTRDGHEYQSKPWMPPGIMDDVEKWIVRTEGWYDI